MNIFIFKKNAILLCSLIAIFVCAGLLAQHAEEVFKSGNRSIPVYSVLRDDNSIALTFNCAWGDEDIDAILKLLEQYKVKATFFLVGEWAEKYPSKALDIAQAGHELGGHSYNHKDYAKLSKKDVESDVTKTINAIREATGISVKYIRVPSGSYSSEAIDAIENMGCIPVQWSVDTIDYAADADVESIFLRATRKTASGDIILMHTGTANTASALSRILDNLSAKYRLCAISELLYETNFYVDNDGKMKIYKE